MSRAFRRRRAALQGITRVAKSRTSMNDGTGRAPRLDIQQSWWAMAGVGDDGGEWSTEEKFERIAAAGFTGILGRLPEPQEARLWRRLLDEYSFSFGIHTFPTNRSDLEEQLDRAWEFGVQYVNSQVMDSFVTDGEAIRLLGELIQAAEQAALPYFVETHRGRITQDLIRTADYVRALPGLRFTIDLSHYVLAGEMVEAQPKAEPYIDAILRRTSCVHGRISNGEQIQIDLGVGGEMHPAVALFRNWWARGMTYWLQEAVQGDVLPFVCELGPPGYSMTHPLTGREISDRWQQALALKELVEQVWSEAQAKVKYPG
jgi:hypothetical protein